MVPTTLVVAKAAGPSSVREDTQDHLRSDDINDTSDSEEQTFEVGVLFMGVC